MPPLHGGAGSALDQEDTTGLPGALQAGLEQLSGLDLSGLRVHYNSAKPAQLQALAYTQGRDIHVGPGQEQHLPHEGWHAVQQLQGRVKPTLQLQGRVPLNDDGGLEREADVMGFKAMQGLPERDSAPASLAKPANSAHSDVVQGKLKYSKFAQDRDFEDPKAQEKGTISIYKIMAHKNARNHRVQKTLYALHIDRKTHLVSDADELIAAIRMGKYEPFMEEYEKTPAKDPYAGFQAPKELLKQATQEVQKNRRFVDVEKINRRAERQERKAAELERRARLRAEINAESGAEGMQKFGKLLETAVPDPGDQVTLDVKFRIPVYGLPGGALYILVAISGLAGRGIEGLTTSGYPKIGKDNHLEVSGNFQLGFGGSFKLLGDLLSIDISAALKIFIRSGADSTQAAIDALSYGIYRHLSSGADGGLLPGVGSKIATWWKGSGDVVKAEQWAQSIETSALEKQQAFADIGWGIEGSGSLGAGGGSAGLSGGYERFKRYDQEAVEKSLGKFGKNVKKESLAKKRQEHAVGQQGRAFYASIEIAIPGGVTITAAVSAESMGAKGQQTAFGDNVGLVISGEVAGFGDDSTKLAKIIGGILASGVSVVTKVKKIIDNTQKNKKKKEKDAGLKQVSRGLESIAATALAVKGMSDKLGEQCAEIGDSSLTLTLTMGYAGGVSSWRVDVQQAKGLSKGKKNLKFDLDVAEFELKKVGRVMSIYSENKETPKLISPFNKKPKELN